MKKGWGFDVKDRDEKVRAQDDFYTHAAGSWLARHPIPKTEARWGSFTILRYDTDKQLRAIVNELSAKKSLPAGSPERLIRDFYRSAMDVKRRNELGLRPLEALRARIAALKNERELLDLIADLQMLGVDVPFGAGIDQDSKDSEKYLIHLYQSGLGLPDRDYYLKNDEESSRIRTAYVPHVEKMFRLMGRNAEDAKEAAQTVMSIETALARVSMTKEDRRDADKVYHKKTVAELSKLAKDIDWARFFARIHAGAPKAVIAMQPQFLAAASSMIARTPIEDWKAYLEWHLVGEFAPYLSSRIVAENFAFYGTVLSGTKVMKPLWRRALKMVEAELGELLGRIYVAKHFPPAAKKKMDLLVDDLFEAYEARLKVLDWMSPATRKKALKKLGAFNRKIGYPKRWRSYKSLIVRPDDLVGNVMRASVLEHKRQMKKLSKPIDREEWFMFPQTVNAYFAPNLNDIVFPAAILQPPFFDFTADDSVNYAAIGTVIGHEITHGFDDQGSKYDERGNLKTWWTPEDRKRFEKKAEILRKQYDKYEVADGVKVSGKLTLGENIADLGGIAIAFDAYQRRLKKTGRKDLDGLTPEQRFFYCTTLFDRENSRPEFQKMAALTDPHSPAKFRINGPLSNLAEFFEAFDVKKGDALHRPSSDRAQIW